MPRPSPAQFLITLAAGVLLVVSAVGFIGEDDETTPSGDSAPGAVAIAGFRFNPEQITVNVGDAVTWTNEDEAVHTVTTTDDGPIDSGDVAGGATYELVFDEAGTFAYICTLHPNMDGTVEVTDQ